MSDIARYSVFQRRFWAGSTLPSRIVLITAIFVLAIPVTPFALAISWLASLTLFGVVEYLTFRERAFRNQTANRQAGIGLARYGLGLVVALHCVAALVFMWMSGVQTVRVSAILILLICMMSLLLQTFNNPKVFFIFVAPYALAAVAGAGELIHGALKAKTTFASSSIVASAG